MKFLGKEVSKKRFTSFLLRDTILSESAESAGSEANMEEYGFTEDEIEVVSDYLLRKMMRLEESGLTDSYCYPRIASFRAKLLRKDREKI